MTPRRTAQILHNLDYVRQVNYQVERVLIRLAERQLAAVWDYFGTRLTELIKAAGDTEADFTLAILQNYRGKTSTYVVLKEIVSRFPHDDRKMSGVRISIDSTSIVSGEFGLAEAWRAKKESLTEWLADERLAVNTFAEKHIGELDLMIASEQRRAEAEREMRNRSYDENDKSDEGVDNEGEQ